MHWENGKYVYAVPEIEETLKAIDGSIIKWKKIVKNPTTNVGRICPLCEIHRCTDCPVCWYTGVKLCKNTSFYSTSIFLKHTYRTNNHKKHPRKANNHMLTELYDIRRRYIAEIFCNSHF